MKQSTIFSLLSAALVCVSLQSCSVGASKDFLSGLSVSYEGLSVDDVYLTVNNQKLNSNKFPMDTQVYMYFGGVEGYEQVNGKVFPGMSIKVTDPSNQVILDAQDLFERYSTSGVSPADAASLSSNLDIGVPMEKGKKYTWAVKVWDKKGEGEIYAEIDFEVQ